MWKMFLIEFKKFVSRFKFPSIEFFFSWHLNNEEKMLLEVILQIILLYSISSDINKMPSISFKFLYVTLFMSDILKIFSSLFLFFLFSIISTISNLNRRNFKIKVGCNSMMTNCTHNVLSVALNLLTFIRIHNWTKKFNTFTLIRRIYFSMS